MAKEDVYYIEVLGKALDVLEVFARAKKRQLLLAEICGRVRLNKNAVFRILYTLAQHGYITKENHKYELGSKVLDLSDGKLRHIDLRIIARPHLEALRDEFQQTANLAVLEGNHIIYLEVIESPLRLRLTTRIGLREPAHCTALGKAHLAYMPFDEVRRLFQHSELPSLTPYSITTMSALKADLEATRARGYAVDKQETVIGGCCVGAPILTGEGRPVGAISISGPLASFNEAQIAEVGRRLREVCATISTKLGTSSEVSDETVALPR